MGAVRRKDIAVADQTAVITDAIPLPSAGYLEACSAEMTKLSTGPIWAQLSIGPDASTGMRKTAGWIRGGSDFGDADGIDWQGRSFLGGEISLNLFFALRNDSGAAAQVTIEWEISDEPPVPILLPQGKVS